MGNNQPAKTYVPLEPFRIYVAKSNAISPKRLDQDAVKSIKFTMTLKPLPFPSIQQKLKSDGKVNIIRDQSLEQNALFNSMISKSQSSISKNMSKRYRYGREGVYYKHIGNSLEIIYEFQYYLQMIQDLRGTQNNDDQDTQRQTNIDLVKKIFTLKDHEIRSRITSVLEQFLSQDISCFVIQEPKSQQRKLTQLLQEVYSEKWIEIVYKKSMELKLKPAKRNNTLQIVFYEWKNLREQHIPNKIAEIRKKLRYQ